MTKTGTVDVAQYLFQRIQQLGISNIFGVPGDFNLHLLDYIYKFQDLKWIGCCNELNAAYACDGYGRVRSLPGVLITTYGVGELSALNGISGAYAEGVPILHIVGTTGRPIQKEQLLIHHVSPAQGLELPDHEIYQTTNAPFRCAHAFLTDPSKAAQQIDDVITAVWKQSLPGYIYIPVDMVWQQVTPDATLSLETPLTLQIVNEDKQLEDELVDTVLDLIYSAKSPTILADTLAERHRAKDLISQLVDKTQFWSYTTPLGKGIIDETNPAFVGVYNGTLSLEGVAQSLHSSDLVLNIGPILSDSNTGGFTREILPENLILFHQSYIIIKGKTYKNIHFLPVLDKIVNKLDLTRIPKPQAKPIVKPAPDYPSPADISQSYLVKAMSSYMREDDLFIVESGTFQFAFSDVKFQKNTSTITQIFYSSIGFTLPATLGAAIAKRELKKPGRVVLVEGDGSAQMTIQELGTMIRQGLTPTVFLLNNDGYSIERAIWGPDQGYNDICPRWNWTQLLSTFGGVEGKNVQSYKVESRAELEALFENQEFMESSKMQLVEVILDSRDYPWRLRDQVKAMGAKNVALFKKYSLENDPSY